MSKFTPVQKCIHAATLLGAVLAIAVPAAATVRGSMQAYACKTIEPATSTASTGLVRGGSGLVNTDSGQAKTVFCPVERLNNVSPTSPVNSALSSFKVYFKNPTNSFLCSLSSEDAFGNVRQSYVRNSGPSPYDFGASMTTEGDATFNLYCSIGPSDTLLSYTWVEG